MREPRFFERNLVAFAAGLGHELDDWCQWFSTKWNQGPGREVGIFLGAVCRIVSWPLVKVGGPIARLVGAGLARVVGRRRVEHLAARRRDLVDGWATRQAAWSIAVAQQFDRLAGVGSQVPMGQSAGGPGAAGTSSRASEDITADDLDDHAEDSVLIRSILEEDDAERRRWAIEDDPGETKAGFSGPSLSGPSCRDAAEPGAGGRPPEHGGGLDDTRIG